MHQLLLKEIFCYLTMYYMYILQYTMSRSIANTPRHFSYFEEVEFLVFLYIEIVCFAYIND